MTKLSKVFDGARVVTLAGNKNTGKTNNVVHLIKEQREATPKLSICVFGFAPCVMDYLVLLMTYSVSN